MDVCQLVETVEHRRQPSRRHRQHPVVGAPARTGTSLSPRPLPRAQFRPTRTASAPNAAPAPAGRPVWCRGPTASSRPTGWRLRPRTPAMPPAGMAFFNSRPAPGRGARSVAQQLRGSDGGLRSSRGTCRVGPGQQQVDHATVGHGGGHLVEERQRHEHGQQVVVAVVVTRPHRQRQIDLGRDSYPNWRRVVACCRCRLGHRFNVATFAVPGQGTPRSGPTDLPRQTAELPRVSRCVRRCVRNRPRRSSRHAPPDRFRQL